MSIDYYGILGIIALIGIILFALLGLWYILTRSAVEDAPVDEEYFDSHYSMEDDNGETFWYHIPTSDQLQEVFDLLRNLIGREVIVTWQSIPDQRGVKTLTIREANIIEEDYMSINFAGEDGGEFDFCIGSLTIPDFCRNKEVTLYDRKVDTHYTYRLKPQLNQE